MKLQPLNSDVLLKHRPEHLAKNSVIFYKDNSDEDPKQFFDVIAVGPDVKYVSVGDVVLARWTHITPPFSIDATDKTKYGLTAEKEILAIVEL